MTQAALARRLGTTQSAVARWEAGSTLPSLETLQRIVHACELELRIGLAPRDLDGATLIERNLVLSPTERLDQLVRAVSFIRAGRSAMAKRDG